MLLRDQNSHTRHSIVRVFAVGVTINLGGTNSVNEANSSVQ